MFALSSVTCIVIYILLFSIWTVFLFRLITFILKYGAELPLIFGNMEGEIKTRDIP
jgi:hypothetical protein